MTAFGDSGGTNVWRGTASRYSLLPLRIFLGVTFIYAGIDKLTDSAFFSDSASGSLVATLNAVKGSAAIPALIDLALKNPDAFGYAIAYGEIAVGLGTLVGLLSRIAAFGGALISLSFWLTISWATTPYYYGNDLIYMIAWLPIVIAGAPVWSLDAVIGRRRRRGSSPTAAGDRALPIS